MKQVADPICAQLGCYLLLCYCGYALEECPHDGPKNIVYSGDHWCGVPEHLKRGSA